MDDPDELHHEVIGGGTLYVYGPIAHERMWLEPRAWWQFWKPRYVEKYERWDEYPPSRDSGSRAEHRDV